MTAPVFLLAVLIIYMPNQITFPSSLGVTGLNVFNLLFMLAVIVVFVTSHGQKYTRPPMTGVLLTYYAVLALAVVMAFLRGSPHPLEDVIAYKTLVSYSLMYFVAYYSARTLSQVRFLLVMVLLVFVVAAFEAIAQGIAYGLDDFDYARRASGPFGEDAGNSNFAGVFYAMFATFSLAIALLGKGLPFRYRAFAMALYVIGGMAIVATFSRQAILIITLTSLLLSLRKSPLVAAMAVAVLLAYPLWAPQGVVERIEMTQQRSASGEERLEASAASRYELWGGAFEIVKRNPAGVGLNQFRHEVDPYLPEWVEARDAQNQYLRFASEVGIQGLLVFLAILYSFFRLGRRMSMLSEPLEARVLGKAFTMMVVAICLGNVFSSTFAFGTMMANVWVLCGLLARYTVLAEQDALVGEASGDPIERIRQVYARWQRPMRDLERS